MPNISFECALLIARKKVDQLAQEIGDRFDFFNDSTIEIEQGWIFFFNTTDFVRTRNHESALAGNCPIFITREGLIHELPSGIPWEESLNKINTVSDADKSSI